MAEKEATLLLRIKQAGAEALDRVVITLGDIGNIAKKAAEMLVDTAKAIFDLVAEGEKVAQIDRSFESLAKSAGLSASAIRDGLVGAAKGLADDTDIIQAANRGIVALGSQADKLPQVMELARKATTLFGGDLVQNFEAMNHAIASGNTRALKHMGIMVDAEAAVKKYAESLGVSVDKLNEAGKQQAIMNEVLAQGSAKFSGIDEGSQVATKGLKKLMVAFGQLYEAASVAMSLLASSAFGSAFKLLQGGIESVTETIKGKFGEATDRLSYGLKTTGEEIVTLKAKIAQLDEKYQQSSFFEKNAIQNSITRLTGQLREKQDEYQRLSDSVPAGANGPTLAEVRQREEQEAAKATLHIIKQTELEKQMARNESAKAHITLIGASAEQELAAEIASYDKKIAAAATAAEKIRLAREQSRLLEQQAVASQKAVDEAAEITELEAEIERTNYYRQLDTDDKAEQLAAHIAHLDKLASLEKDHDKKITFMRESASAKEQLDGIKKNAKEVEADKKKKEILAQQLSSFLSHMSSLQSSNNQALMVIGKAAAIAQITISTSKAAADGYAWGMTMGGPALASTFAALAYAAGAANVARVAGVQLAEGGVVRARPGGIQATIGEGGRDEAVIPLENGRVPGMSGGTNVTIIVNGGLLGDQSSARELAVALDRELLKLRQNNESQAFDQGLV